jgi:hypothetical protein
LAAKAFTCLIHCHHSTCFSAGRSGGSGFTTIEDAFRIGRRRCASFSSAKRRSGDSGRAFYLCVSALCGKPHAAPVLFDRANYASLAKSDSAATIEPGTQITLGNWQRYRRFLPFGIQILYGGRNFWHVGSSAEFTITVGPTIDYTWPRQYRGVWRARFCGVTVSLPGPNTSSPLQTKAKMRGAAGTAPPITGSVVPVHGSWLGLGTTRFPLILMGSEYKSVADGSYGSVPVNPLITPVPS